MAQLFLDLDNFKRVNDTLGHQAGDELLIAVADRLRACARADDLVVRLGGDELVILAENVARPEDAAALAASIIEAFQPPFTLRAGLARTTPSIGIALNDPDGDADDPVDLLRRADHAMYRAKMAGKGRYALFDPILDVAPD